MFISYFHSENFTSRICLVNVYFVYILFISAVQTRGPRQHRLVVRGGKWSCWCRRRSQWAAAGRHEGRTRTAVRWVQIGWWFCVYKNDVCLCFVSWFVVALLGCVMVGWAHSRCCPKSSNRLVFFSYFQTRIKCQNKVKIHLCIRIGITGKLKSWSCRDSTFLISIFQSESIFYSD